MKNDKFKLGRNEPIKKMDSASIVDNLVSGIEPETTKTFRIPVRLSKALKIHAVNTGQTEKTILLRLITDYLANSKVA